MTTSKCIFLIDNFLLEDTIEKEVVINVDGKESHLIFIDYPHGEIQVEKTTFINDLQFQIKVFNSDNLSIVSYK